jgi:hypothetical protein
MAGDVKLKSAGDSPIHSIYPKEEVVEIDVKVKTGVTPIVQRTNPDCEPRLCDAYPLLCCLPIKPIDGVGQLSYICTKD